MKLVMFCHSLRSDWNHGNAHFLRGVCSEWIARGHRVDVYEPREAWSVQNLERDHGPEALAGYETAYPELSSTRYVLEDLDLDRVLADADLVIVHEWNEPELVRQVGLRRRRGGSFRLLFHDTHHRIVTAPHEMARFDLKDYDGVLAFGDIISRLYQERALAQHVWTWHEAADVRRFRPLPERATERDLVWVGNWGDGERTRELQEFLIEPARDLALSARVHGVRYPDEARASLAAAGIEFAGWLPNFEVPEAFAAARFTVHVPRRPYVAALPGIPTIRVFEALACGIPLVSAPWDDREHLFRPGVDYWIARDGAHMRDLLRDLEHDPSVGAELARSGRETILARHTCGHRVDELLAIYEELTNREEVACAVN